MNKHASRPGREPIRESGWLGLVADWRDFVFLHFAIPPVDLAPHVPHPLDQFNGKAFVSLVAFRFDRLRPAAGIPPALGRFLMSPFSNHQFLNVRTYVRGPLGDGIHFLAEWIDNRPSLRMGPLTHGLPYRYARMAYQELQAGGLRRLAIEDDAVGARATLLVPTTPDRDPRGTRHSETDTFLFERYRAYTHRDGVGRCFEVKHPPWRVAPFSLARFDTSLFERVFPWFRNADFIGGHLAAGFNDVAMSGPVRLDRLAGGPTPYTESPMFCPYPSEPTSSRFGVRSLLHQL